MTQAPPPADDGPDGPTVHRFRPTSGRVLGVVGLVAAAGMLVLAAVELPARPAWAMAFGAVFAGLLAWSALLRPAVHVVGSELMLRGMVAEVRIPLAAIERVAVRQVLAVRAGDRRYVSPAVGRSWRQAARGGADTRGDGDAARDPRLMSYPDLVEDRILRLCEEDRHRRGVALLSDEQAELAGEIRRRVSVPLVAALATSGLGLLATLLV